LHHKCIENIPGIFVIGEDAFIGQDIPQHNEIACHQSVSF